MNPRALRHRALVVLLVLGLALVAPHAPWSGSPRAESDRAAISRSGVLGGASYLIEVPAKWQGGLVVFAHGIQRGSGPGAVGPPPIGHHILAGGHAWVASGYRAREYQPHLFIEDLIALRELFVKEIGQPRWIVIYGRSMGGHLVVASLELHPGLYQGGLAECGLVDGIGIGDYLMAYTAAAELISGVPMLDAPDREAFTRLVAERVLPALGTPGAYTERGRQFDSVVKYLMGGDRAGNDLPLRLEGLRGRYLMNMMYRTRDLENEPNPGLRAASTAHIRYRIDPGLGLTEDEAQRASAAAASGEGLPIAEREPRVRRTHRSAEGAAHHLARDRRCVGAVESRAVVPTPHDCRWDRSPAGTACRTRPRSLRVRRPKRSEQAFDDLVAWIERGAKPVGEDVLAPDLSRIGLKWTPHLLLEDPLAPRR